MLNERSLPAGATLEAEIEFYRLRLDRQHTLIELGAQGKDLENAKRAIFSLTLAINKLQENQSSETNLEASPGAPTATDRS